MYEAIGDFLSQRFSLSPESHLPLKEEQVSTLICRPLSSSVRVSSVFFCFVFFSSLDMEVAYQSEVNLSFEQLLPESTIVFVLVSSEALS